MSFVKWIKFGCDCCNFHRNSLFFIEVKEEHPLNIENIFITFDKFFLFIFLILLYNITEKGDLYENISC